MMNISKEQIQAAQMILGSDELTIEQQIQLIADQAKLEETCYIDYIEGVNVAEAHEYTYTATAFMDALPSNPHKSKEDLFQEYVIMFKFAYPNEPLKKWINKDNYANHIAEDTDLLLELLTKIQGMGFNSSIWSGKDVDIDGPGIKLTYNRGSLKQNLYGAILDFVEWHNLQNAVIIDREAEILEQYKDSNEVGEAIVEIRKSPTLTNTQKVKDILIVLATHFMLEGDMNELDETLFDFVN